MTSAPPRLEVEGLSRAFGAHLALDGVSFVLEPGDFAVLLGPNGAGKTTLVRILSRLARPTSGRVTIDGEDWLTAPAARQSEVGALSHATYLYDGLTALENLRFFAGLYGLADPRGRAAAALETVGLVDRSDRQAGTLSRGQAQRLSIARAILHRPRLLLLDEPYAGLDPHAAGRLSEALAVIRDGATVLLTTHDLARVPPSASRCLVLVDGQLQIDARDETLSPESLAAVYEAAVARSEAAADAA